jgi:hypothetical protein
MRSSVVSLTCAAGALVMVLAYAAEAAAAAGGADCCGDPEEWESAAPGGAGAGGGAGAEAAPPPVPPALRPGALVNANAYADAHAVLKTENSCSRFFGGPRLAVTALNGLASRLRIRALGLSPVGIVMSGDFTVYRDTATGESYRLFEEAVINGSGPFLSRIAAHGSAHMQVGRFPAETRQAKALLLLHELGHLVGAPGGGWVLPNDGGDPRQSERNTQEVESRCLRQLLALD